MENPTDGANQVVYKGTNAQLHESFGILRVVFAFSTVTICACVLEYIYGTNSLGIFCTLWISHALIFVLLFRAGSLSLHPFLWSEELKRLKDLSRQEYGRELSFAERAEKKRLIAWQHVLHDQIPLMQIIIVGIIIFLGVSILIISSEILLYSSLIASQANSMSFIVPLYIICAFAILNSVVCRTGAVLGFLSWSVCLYMLILLNMKLAVTSSGSTEFDLSYSDIIMPLNIIIGFTICYIVFVLMMHYYESYHLKLFQIESIVLYLTGFSSILTSLYLFESYMDEGADFKESSLWVLLVGTCFILSAIYINLDASIKTIIYRKGGGRATSLSQNVEGCWDTDKSKHHINCFMLGEIETCDESVSNKNGYIDNNSFLIVSMITNLLICFCCTKRSWSESQYDGICMCCGINSLELADTTNSARYPAPESRHDGNDDIDNVDERTPMVIRD